MARTAATGLASGPMAALRPSARSTGNASSARVSEAGALLTAALARIARGERNGLQTPERLTSAKLLGVCLRIWHERAEAEDVLQEIYLTVWQKAADFDPARASPMTWLITIARNKAIDRLRSRGHASRMDPI